MKFSICLNRRVFVMTSEDTELDHEAKPSRGITKMRKVEQIMTKQSQHMKTKGEGGGCGGRDKRKVQGVQHITETRLYNFDPLKPHFYKVKLGFTGVYIIFLIFAQKT